MSCTCPHDWRTIPGDLTAQGHETSMGKLWVRTGTSPSCPEHGTEAMLLAGTLGQP